MKFYARCKTMGYCEKEGMPREPSTPFLLVLCHRCSTRDRCFCVRKKHELADGLQETAGYVDKRANFLACKIHHLICTAGILTSDGLRVSNSCLRRSTRTSNRCFYDDCISKFPRSLQVLNNIRAMVSVLVIVFLPFVTVTGSAVLVITTEVVTVVGSAVVVTGYELVTVFVTG